MLCIWYYIGRYNKHLRKRGSLLNTTAKLLLEESSKSKKKEKQRRWQDEKRRWYDDDDDDDIMMTYITIKHDVRQFLRSASSSSSSSSSSIGELHPAVHSLFMTSMNKKKKIGK